MTWRGTLVTVGIASVAAFAANAGTLLTDNFDTDTPALAWSGDSVFSSPSSYAGYTPTFGSSHNNASTDLVASGTFSISCFGGTGNCVDLDGSTGTGNDPAGVLESNVGFGAGLDTLTFDISGNQRGAAAQTTDVYIGSQLIFSSGPLASGSGWLSESVTFSTATGGHLTFVEVGPSDQQGNLLDNVVLSGTSSINVPEPATWALMLFGFGALGGLLRRRGRTVAV